MRCKLKQASNQQAQHYGKYGKFWGGSQYEGDRSGCALVHVGQPHVEWCGSEFEGQARYDKDQPQHEYVALGGVLHDALQYFGQQHTACSAIEHG